MFKEIFSKAFFIFSILIIFIPAVIIYSMRISSFCADFSTCQSVLSNIVGLILFTFGPILPFAAITCFLKESVYFAWVKFTLLWVPILWVSFYLAPTDRGSNGWGMPVLGWGPVIILGEILLYFVVSIIIITVKSFQVYKKNK